MYIVYIYIYNIILLQLPQLIIFIKTVYVSMYLNIYIIYNILYILYVSLLFLLFSITCVLSLFNTMYMQIYIYDANYNNKNERDGKKSVQETDNQKYKKLYS